MIEFKIKKDLGDFNLDIDIKTKSKVLGILGQSGSGKTITLRCISGLEDPDEGYIRSSREYYNSEKDFSMPVGQRNIGYLFQSYGLFPNMTALDNIKFVMNEKSDHDLAMNYLEKVGLKDKARLFPKNLSGGQKQRLAMARMLAINPEMILLDEPFSALDIVLRTEMENFIKDLIEELEIPTILVSHNRKEIYRFCDEVMILDGGRIEDFGPKDRVFREPRTPVAAKLLGYENIIEAEAITEFKLINESNFKLENGSKLAVKNTDIEILAGNTHRVEHVIDEIDNFRYSLVDESGRQVQVFTDVKLDIGDRVDLGLKKFHIL